jgi:hypothetical protein
MVDASRCVQPRALYQESRERLPTQARSGPMNNFGFTVLVSGIDTTQDFEDALFDAGCDDALPVVIDGALFLDFHRDGGTFDEAVRSAASDVARAGGKVVEVSALPE